MLSVFIMLSIVTNRPVIRHYIIPTITIIFFILETLTLKLNKKVSTLIFAVCSIHLFLMLNTHLWNKSKNLLYRIYRKHDTSAHYSNISPLFEYLKDNNIRPKKIVSNEFIRRPLNYLGVIKNPDGPIIYIDHCYNKKCTTDGFNVYLKKPQNFKALLDHKTRFKLED